jgi:hypothetical protein
VLRGCEEKLRRRKKITEDFCRIGEGEENAREGGDGKYRRGQRGESQKG